MLEFTEEVKMNSKYVGGGAYVYYDGCHFWLYASEGIEIQSAVAFGSMEFTSIQRFVKRKMEEIAEELLK